ncbi:hypothetical protein AbraIFM66950_005885 [Aspergillus brasiliensis]|nr:hypothetical protein AbraIFM66950_005885 [Aspergillus brasiliensis]
MDSSSDHPHDRENNHNHNRPHKPALRIDTTIRPTTTSAASASPSTGTGIPSTESSYPKSADSSLSAASSMLSNSSREFTLQLAHPNGTNGDDHDDGIVLFMWPVPASTAAPAPTLAAPSSPVNQADSALVEPQAQEQEQDQIQGQGDQDAQVTTGHNQTTAMENLVTAMAETEISPVSGVDCEVGNDDHVDQKELTHDESGNDGIHQDTAATDRYGADTSTSMDDDFDFEAFYALWKDNDWDVDDDVVVQKGGHGHSASSSVQK